MACFRYSELRDYTKGQYRKINKAGSKHNGSSLIFVVSLTLKISPQPFDTDALRKLNKGNVSHKTRNRRMNVPDKREDEMQMNIIPEMQI